MAAQNVAGFASSGRGVRGGCPPWLFTRLIDDQSMCSLRRRATRSLGRVPLEHRSDPGRQLLDANPGSQADLGRSGDMGPVPAQCTRGSVVRKLTAPTDHLVRARMLAGRRYRACSSAAWSASRSGGFLNEELQGVSPRRIATARRALSRTRLTKGPVAPDGHPGEFAGS